MNQVAEPNPIAADRIRAAALIGICPRSFDTYFGDVPKIKVGTRTLYLIRDLVSKLESMRVDGSRTTTDNAEESASNQNSSAKSGAKGGF